MSAHPPQSSSSPAAFAAAAAARRGSRPHCSARAPPGRYAPNHKLTEPWRFVCLGDQSAAELGVLVADHIGGEKGLKKQQAWAAVPTWIAALCKGQTITEAHTANNQSLPSVMDYTQLEDYAAVCCAVHNMTLSMHTAGVSAKWSTGGVTRKQAFRDLIGAADDELVVGVLMCGFRRPSAPSLQAPRKLRPLTELPEAGDGGDDADADAAALPGFARRAAAAAKPVLCFSP
eukprot:COSAG06_NODE_1314_length_9887_cov_10.607070_8_plen_231_part_00